MKNQNKLDPRLLPYVQGYEWHCGCGQTGLYVSITKKGSVQGHCFKCGYTIFWNDPSVFRFKGGPFGILEAEQPKTKPMKGGGTTSWYQNHRVRIFDPRRRYTA